MEANFLTNPVVQDTAATISEDRFSIFSASQIGESNKRRVLQMLFDLGPTSRADLARLSGTKRTTITGIVQPLLDGGLLIEEEPKQNRGVGKPARPLWFSKDASPVCAVFLMPGRIQTAMVSITGDIYAEQVIDIGHAHVDQSQYADAMSKSIKASLANAKSVPLGIGIAVAGMIDPDSGSIVAMNLAPELAGLKLRSLLEDQFRLTTIIDHHPRAILLGERWFGLGRGLTDFTVIYADEVLGCSLYLNGELFRGPHGSGGELGHTIVKIGGEICTCGKRGCWETIATLPWLRTRAADLHIKGAETLNVQQLCELAKNKADAKSLLDEYALNLAIGMANLQTLLMPNNFVIYGNVARGDEEFRQKIQTHLVSLSPVHPSVTINVMFGSDQKATTLRGAAGLIIEDKLKISY